MNTKLLNNMFLDEYSIEGQNRPDSYNKFITNKNIRLILKSIIKSKSIDNMIVIGKISTGKTSFVNMFLRAYYDNKNNLFDKYVRYFNKIDDLSMETLLTNVLKKINIIDKNNKKVIVIDSFTFKDKHQQIFIDIMNNDEYNNIKFIFIINDLYKISNELQARSRILYLDEIELDLNKLIKDNLQIENEIIINKFKNNIIDCSKNKTNNKYVIRSIYTYLDFIKNIVLPMEKNIIKENTFIKYFNKPSMYNIKNIINNLYNGNIKEVNKTINILRNLGYTNDDILDYIINLLEKNIFNENINIYSKVSEKIRSYQCEILSNENYDSLSELQLEALVYKFKK